MIHSPPTDGCTGTRRLPTATLSPSRNSWLESNWRSSHHFCFLTAFSRTGGIRSFESTDLHTHSALSVLNIQKKTAARPSRITAVRRHVCTHHHTHTGLNLRRRSDLSTSRKSSERQKLLLLQRRECARFAHPTDASSFQIARQRNRVGFRLRPLRETVSAGCASWRGPSPDDSRPNRGETPLTTTKEKRNHRLLSSARTNWVATLSPLRRLLHPRERQVAVA